MSNAKPQTLRAARLSCDNSVAVVGCPRVGPPVFAICTSFWIHYSQHQSGAVDPTTRDGNSHQFARPMVTLPPSDNSTHSYNHWLFGGSAPVCGLTSHSRKTQPLRTTHPWRFRGHSYTFFHQTRDSTTV
uniref:Uncharacterized protein n=1 Tax=Trypanosoma congolense (strain IL3000) TaxID=1068625 RepID=G0UQS9_TRYCI|nr:hypothetical protein, unlikely [Trypanosoma congolense IL3000]